MNGTMDEPADISSPNSPENKNSSKVQDEEHCTDSHNSNTLNKIDTEILDGNKNNNEQQKSEEDSCGDSNKNQNYNCNSDSQTNIPEVISDPLKNHCNNSGQSISETESSQTNGTNNDGNIIPNEKKTVTKDTEESSEESNEESSEEGSVMSRPMKEEEEAVSIHSDSDVESDETSQESHSKQNDSDIIILENENGPESFNGNSRSSGSPEIHEIISDNDDCVSINDDKSSTSSSTCKIRHTQRGVKRKNYDDMENGDFESDIEEIETEDPLNSKSKPIIINDTKHLVEMAAKKGKANHNNKKKEPTVVIIDTKSKNSLSKANNKTSTANMSTNAQNLYQSIIARGTTVTPISSKTNTYIPSTTSFQGSPQSPNSQASILPSLTDDMFVVEAPSFIVPYVYEKPSVKPFKEFVTKLGQQLEEQKKREKEEKDKIRKEKQEKGEPVSESDDEKEKQADENEGEKKKKTDKKKHRRPPNDDDDDSWDGESSVDSDDQVISDDDSSIIKDKSIEVKETNELAGGKSDNYFDCSLGKFFIDIGVNLVQEFVQNDLLKQQTRKLNREKKSGRNTKATESSINSLMKNLEFSKENNAPYTFPQNKCEFCSFKSDSTLVMNHHLGTPHMKNNIYRCNFCAYEIKSPHDILHHMESEHEIIGKLERAPAYHQCTNCPFEDNGKGKLARHQIACAKKFKPEINLAPPIEWEPPAKIPKIVRSRNNMSMSNTYQNAFSRQLPNSLNKTMSINNLMMGGGVGTGIRPRGRIPMAVPPLRAGLLHGVPIVRGRATIRQNNPIASNFTLSTNGKQKSTHQPSISITPLPRHPPPIVQTPVQPTKGTFVICEICDGYIKDLEQLRNHMQWIHKVKIHPKMIYNRPPLNCQKCQFRFFTDQGLERHLLGSHGLVTSSMQEAANKGKDAGRCPVCGRVYQWKLLSHVAKDHSMTLKPAHLSYKCTVCTATFGMYKQFENHVYSAHSVVAKKVMDKSKPPAATTAKSSNDSLLKPVKINDEITIIPQSVKATSSRDK